MGKKRELDPGLKYLQDIKFNRVRGKYGLNDRWIRLYGEQKANELFVQAGKLPVGSEEFYEFKNSDPDLSKSFAETFDGDIIRKACNYIDSHKEYFGDTILEVGCDIGYMTGFLAKTFPQSKIVSIDRNHAAIEMASQRINQMGVTNVEFRHCSLDEITEQFDTVFCMRIMQENANHDETPFNGESLVYQVAKYALITKPYTQSLLKCVKEDGYLFAFERIRHDPLMYGWLTELNNQKCGILQETYQEIVCEEAAVHSTFQAFVCKPGLIVSPEDIWNFWYKPIEMERTDNVDFAGWTALVYLHVNAGKLLKGVRIYNKDKETIGRFAAFLDKNNDQTVLFLNAIGGDNTYLTAHSINFESIVLNKIESAVTDNTKNGFLTEEIDPDDIYLEGHGILALSN